MPPLGLLAVVVLQLSHHVQTADNGEELLKQLEGEQDVPYLLEVNIIRIHMPLSWWHRWDKPCPDRNQEDDVRLLSHVGKNLTSGKDDTHVWGQWRKNFTNGKDDSHVWGQWRENNMTDSDDAHQWGNGMTDDGEDARGDWKKDNVTSDAWRKWSKDLSGSDGWRGMSDAPGQDSISSATEVPLERNNWHSRHQSTGTPTAATAPEQFAHPTATSYPPNQIVVPDAAALVLLFTNGSRLDDSIEAFGFSGTYSVRVTRAGGGVQVVLTLLSAELEALPAEELLLSVSGPTTVGLQGSPASGDLSLADRDLDRLAHQPLQGAVWKRRRDKGGSKSNWPGDKQPIYINGSALTDDELCDLSFNVSGVFMVNKSMTADTTTVVVAQLIATGGSAHQPLQAVEGAAAAGDGSGGWQLLSLIMVAGAVVTLLTAVVVWRVTRRRGGSFVRFSQSYGTIQRPLDATGYYDGREVYP